MSQTAIGPFFLALVLLLGFALVRARGARQKLQNLLVICAFMEIGFGIGLALGFIAGNTTVGSYFGAELVWALGSIAAVGRIRKNRRFARIHATGVAY